VRSPQLPARRSEPSLIFQERCPGANFPPSGSCLRLGDLEPSLNFCRIQSAHLVTERMMSQVRAGVGGLLPKTGVVECRSRWPGMSGRIGNVDRVRQTQIRIRVRRDDQIEVRFGKMIGCIKPVSNDAGLRDPPGQRRDVLPPTITPLSRTLCSMDLQAVSR
jgi:hypothetical protein